MLKKLFSNEIEIPETLSKGYIPSLDGIRAFAICFVIISHINLQRHIAIITKIFGLGLGVLGVHIFFVISGFLITVLLLKELKATGDINLKKFYIRRSLRILPVATLFVIILIILNQVFSLGIQLEKFLFQLTYTENFNSDYNVYTRHYWSLSLEEQFYVIFPFILRKSLKSYTITAFVIFAISPIVVAVKYHFPFHQDYLNVAVKYVDLFLNSGLISILIGSLFAIALCKFPVLSSIKLKWINFIQIINIYLVWVTFNSKVPGGLGGILLPILIAILIISLIYYQGSVLFKLLNLKFITTIGVLSYSLYIWQQIFTIHLPWKGYSHFTDLLIVNLLGLFIVAYVSYNYYEKPFLLLKKRFETVKNTHLP